MQDHCKTLILDTLLLSQHVDYPKVRWVICSVCENENPKNARKEVPVGGTTTGLKRHIELQHPNKIPGNKQVQRKQKSKENSEVS